MSLPKKATAYDFSLELVSQADTRLFQSNPTLASGDWQVSKDYGTFSNLATLPTITPSSTRQVKVQLSATEMTCDNLGLQAVDAAGAEWCDNFFAFSLGTRTADDLAYPATSGRSMNVSSGGVVDADAKAVNAVLTSSVTTINANLGTTQPTNFTGTAGSALVKADAIDIASVAQTAGDIYAQVTNMGAIGSALPMVATSRTLNGGTTETGTLANTNYDDGTYWTLNPSGNAIDVEILFDVAAVYANGNGVSFYFKGYGAGLVNNYKFEAYDWVAAAYKQIHLLPGIAGVINGQFDEDLNNNNVGTGGNAKKVKIRISGTGLTTGSLNADHMLVGVTNVLSPPTGWSSQVIGSDGGVVLAQFLADGTTPAAHGGPVGTSVATIACSRFVGVSQTANTPAWSMTGNGTGAGGLFQGGDSDANGLVGRGGGDFGSGLVGITNATLASANGYGGGILGYGGFLNSNETAGIYSFSVGGHSSVFQTIAAAKDGIKAIGTDHDIACTGTGDILGNLAGRVLGTGSTAFAGVGVQADARQVLGATIPETNAGQVAANFGEFFDVTPTSTKTINDVGGGGSVTIDMSQALPGSPTVGTVGEALKFSDTRLDADISTRLAASGYTAPDNTSISSILATVSTNLDATVSSRLAAGSYSTIVTLAANGLDGIMIGSLNARQALAVISAACYGPSSGFTGLSGQTPIYTDDNGVTRIQATCDTLGNRSTVTITPPP